MAMLNIVSLPKHLDEIRLLLHDKKMDVLALNETRLDPTISDELVNVVDNTVTSEVGEEMEASLLLSTDIERLKKQKRVVKTQTSKFLYETFKINVQREM